VTATRESTADTVDPLRHRHIRLAGDRIALRAHRRSIFVGTLLAALVVFTALVSLGVGEVHLPLSDVAGAFTGQTNEGTAYIVLVLRLPRILTALLVGIAFAVSGAVFQSLTATRSAARTSSGSPRVPPRPRCSPSWRSARARSASRPPRWSAGW
jgi:ABC-type enterobactin transport system permease subunit